MHGFFYQEPGRICQSRTSKDLPTKICLPRTLGICQPRACEDLSTEQQLWDGPPRPYDDFSPPQHRISQPRVGEDLPSESCGRFVNKDFGQPRPGVTTKSLEGFVTPGPCEDLSTKSLGGLVNHEFGRICPLRSCKDLSTKRLGGLSSKSL